MFNRDLLLIELGSSHVKMGLAHYAKGIVRIKDAFIVDLPEQVYTDGKIIDAEALRSLIFEEILKRSIKTKEVYLTLNGSHVITREMVLPDVAENEFEEMISYEIQQFMPINLENYRIEYKTLEHFEDKEHMKVRVLVAAVSRDDVDAYYKLLLALQLKPLGMDINGNAISKLFSPLARVNAGDSLGEKTIALIDLGSKSIDVTILEKGVIHLSRLIEAGEELEIIKISEEPNNEVLNTLFSRVQRVFQFYTSRHSGNKIDGVYLFGGLANNEFLVQYFMTEFSMPVEVINDLSTVALGTKEIDLKRYLNMLGCIAREKQVN